MGKADTVENVDQLLGGAVLVRQNPEWSQGHLGDTDDALGNWCCGARSTSHERIAHRCSDTYLEALLTNIRVVWTLMVSLRAGDMLERVRPLVALPDRTICAMTVAPEIVAP